MPIYKFTVIVEKDEDGLYVASCPAIQGCYSQGETLDEAMENIKDAINVHIEARKEAGETIPLETVVTEVEVVA